MPRPSSPYRTWADAAALRSLADALDAATADLDTSPATPRVLFAGALTLHMDTVDNGNGQQVYAIDLRRPCKRPPSRPVGEPHDQQRTSSR